MSEDLIKLLLGDKNIDAKSLKTADGRTPLIMAVESGYFDAVKILVEEKDAPGQARSVSAPASLP